MTYKELTEGIIKLWKKDARLMDVDDLTKEYFRAVQQRAGGNRKWLESEVTWTVEDLTREAYTAMQREENDNSQRERADLLCLVIINLIGYLEEFGIISWTRMALWLQNIGELKDRGTAYFLGLDAVEENIMEREKVARGRRSLNLKLKQEYAGKKEDELVLSILKFIGASKGMAEIKTMRCFLFGGEDDGLMLEVTKARPLAWLLRTLRGMGIYEFPHNIYELADGWFRDKNGKIVKNWIVKASKYQIDSATGEKREEMEQSLMVLSKN